MVLSKIILYLLQDGCTYIFSGLFEVYDATAIHEGYGAMPLDIVQAPRVPQTVVPGSM